MNNGYTNDVIESLTTGKSASLVRETIRAGVRSSPTRDEAVHGLMYSTIRATAPFMEGVPPVVCAIVARALTRDVDWSAVLDAVCVEAECN
jgi:hypothetical protein